MSLTTAKQSSDSSSAVLWHFTDQQSLFPILLGNNGLMACHTSFMSDTEDSSLSKRATSLLVRFGADIVPLFESHAIVPDAAKELGILFAKTGSLVPTFATCFSTTTKEPRLWQEHTKEGGFAIGFSPCLMDELKSRISNDTLFQSCQYNTFETTERLLLEIEESVSHIGPWVSGQQKGSDDKKEQALKVIAKISKAIRKTVFVKQSKFSWEHEYRLAYVFENEVPKDRLRFIGEKPFLTMELSDSIGSYVKEIRISPFGNRDKSCVIASLVGTAIGLDADQIKLEQMQ